MSFAALIEDIDDIARNTFCVLQNGVCVFLNCIHRKTITIRELTLARSRAVWFGVGGR